jgi:hypothetical protein
MDRLVPVFSTVADALAGPGGVALSPEDTGDEDENPARVARA